MCVFRCLFVFHATPYTEYTRKQIKLTKKKSCFFNFNIHTKQQWGVFYAAISVFVFFCFFFCSIRCILKFKSNKCFYLFVWLLFFFCLTVNSICGQKKKVENKHIKKNCEFAKNNGIKTTKHNKNVYLKYRLCDNKNGLKFND